MASTKKTYVYVVDQTINKVTIYHLCKNLPKRLGIYPLDPEHTIFGNVLDILATRRARHNQKSIRDNVKYIKEHHRIYELT